MASKVIVTKEQLDRIDNAISTISGVVRARTLPEMAEAILQLAPSSDYVTHEEFEEAMAKLEGLTVYGTADLGSDPDCNYVSIDANSTDKIIITATNTDGDVNETYHLKVTESGISFILDGETDPVYTLEPNSGIEYTGIAPIDVDNTDYEISIADATSSVSGAMSATDKAKLDALPSAISGTAPISVSNGTISIPQASLSSDGYMSSSDKSKLDTLPSSITGTGAISVTSGVVSVDHATADSDGIISSSDYLKLNSLPSSVTGTAPISVNNGAVSISDATTSASGAMSATDKSKLDSLPSSITGTAPISVTNGVVSIANATMYSAGAMTDVDKFKANTYNVQYMNKFNAFDIGSSDTTRLELSGTGGTGSNKIVVGASNDTDNKKYSLQVNENGVVLHSEDLITHYQEDVFTLTPGGGGGGSVSGQAPIHVNNDVVSISPASQSSEGSMSAADKIRLDTISTCYYGTCMSTADTATKVVTCSGYEFKEGNIIGISFAYGINSDNGVYLNINNTGAKVVYVGNAVSNNTNNLLFADSGSMVYFIAKGSVYEVLSIVTAGAKQQAYGSGTWYGTCNTAAGTSTKAVTSNGFKWTKGSVISVDFSTANTSDVVVLSVNGTYPVVGSAVPVYYNGSPTSSSNKLTWEAGETITFMYMGSDIISAQDPGHFIVIAKSSSLDATDKAKLDKLSIDSSISGLTIGSDHIEVTNQSLPMSYDIYPATSSSGLATTTDNGYMSSSDKSKLESLPSSVTGTTPIDVTNGVVSIPKAGVVIDAQTRQPVSYTAGYMSGQEMFKLGRIDPLTNGMRLNDIPEGQQQWRLFLGDYNSVHNYGANSKTIMGLKNDNSVGDGLFLSSYATDGTLDGKFAIGSKGIRLRDSSGDVAWDLKMPLTTVSLGSAQTGPRSMAIWRGINNSDVFGDYMAFGAQNDDASDGFRLYIGEKQLAFRQYTGSTQGSYIWQLYPSTIPQFKTATSKMYYNDNTGTDAYWKYYMDGGNIFGWVRITVGNHSSTATTNKSCLLDYPTEFTQDITIGTSTANGARFTLTPFGQYTPELERYWVDSYNAIQVTVRADTVSATTRTYPLNMQFYMTYTNNSN